MDHKISTATRLIYWFSQSVHYLLTSNMTAWDKKVIWSNKEGKKNEMGRSYLLAAALYKSVNIVDAGVAERQLQAEARDFAIQLLLLDAQPLDHVLSLHAFHIPHLSFGWPVAWAITLVR